MSATFLPPRRQWHWRREFALGLLRTAREEWIQILILVACDSWAFYEHGFFAGLGWAVTTFSYLVTMWVFGQAREGWEAADKLAKLIQGVARGTHEIKRIEPGSEP